MNSARRGTLLAAAQTPTAEWLESIFGAESLWRPTEGELPEHLTDEESRTFLTKIGFPAVHLDFIDFNSTGLAKAGPWAEDPDDIDLYDPNGWDHARGYAGHVIDSLPLLAGALGLLASYENRLFGDTPEAALREVRSLIDELEPIEDSRFWEEIFERLEDQ